MIRGSRFVEHFDDTLPMMDHRRGLKRRPHVKRRQVRPSMCKSGIRRRRSVRRPTSSSTTTTCPPLVVWCKKIIRKFPA
ncbi:predicted protein [Lichtheimia corymbifera JMRC:FSU:9682]|uniref:Uncharacterized protein n=1 Tax=Lichtheimia corymbifera JMRC:FSU:9682 TaxID=1263082 RepID=A0A068RYD3_9FUNG|nr:predicted protein [Lichtheimia corymbifera JMRC:FSU:9682]